MNLSPHTNMVKAKMAQNFGNRNKTHYLSAFEISYKFHN